MSDTLRVLVVDDHAVVRAGLRRLLDEQRDLTVVAEAEDGPRALELASKYRPQVVVMDFAMPGIDGAEVTSRLKKACPTTKVLCLTVYDDARHLRRMLAAGASGYLLKRAAAQELVGAIRVVAAGGTFLDPRVASSAAAALTQDSTTRPPDTLTDRETEVMRLLAWGHTNREVGDQLSLSTKTVETHRARAMVKLGLQTRAELVKYAVEQGWLER